MKRLSTIALLGALVSGCASTPPMTPETAFNTCERAGIKRGTPAIVDCVVGVLNSEAAKGKPSPAMQYMLNRASNPGIYNSSPLPTNTTCSRTCSYVNCQTSQW